MEGGIKVKKLAAQTTRMHDIRALMDRCLQWPRLVKNVVSMVEYRRTEGGKERKGKERKGKRGINDGIPSQW